MQEARERPVPAQAAPSRPPLEPREHFQRPPRLERQPVEHPPQDHRASREPPTPAPPATEPGLLRSTQDGGSFKFSAPEATRFDAPADVSPSAYDDTPAFEPTTDPYDLAQDDAGRDHDAEFAEALGADEPAEADYYEEAPFAEVASYPVEEPGASLVSPDAAASIASHFQALAASMVINDSGLLHEYAREMLRPMLKQWLDDNLPVMVERLIRAEIERVARGRR